MIRILYIDDEPALLTLTQIYLKEEADFDVMIANSAETGLSMLRSEAFDVVISDYDMPDMDGIELLKCVRAEKPLIPFIIFTGKGREEVVIDALNNGADFYLQKGGDPKPLFTELAHAVSHLVRRSQAEDNAIKNEKYWLDFYTEVNECLNEIEESAKNLVSSNNDNHENRDISTRILKATDRIRHEMEYNPVQQKEDD